MMYALLVSFAFQISMPPRGPAHSYLRSVFA